MTDETRLAALNHLGEKMAEARKREKSATSVEERLKWSRLVKRYRILVERFFSDPV